MVRERFRGFQTVLRSQKNIYVAFISDTQNEFIFGRFQVKYTQNHVNSCL